MTSANTAPTCTVEYTFFPSFKNPQGARKRATLEELAELHRSTVKPTKKTLPLIALTLYPDDARTTGVDPQAFTGVILDYDDGKTTYDQALKLLHDLRLQAFVHETASSNTPEKPFDRFHVCLPFRKPLDEVSRQRVLKWLRERMPEFTNESTIAKQPWYIGSVKGHTSRVDVLPGFTIDDMARPKPKLAGGWDHEAARQQVIDTGDGHHDYAIKRAGQLVAQGEDALDVLLEEDETYFGGHILAKHGLKELKRWCKGIEKKHQRKQETSVDKPRPKPELPPADDNDPYRFHGDICDLLEVKFPRIDWVVNELMPPGLMLLVAPPKTGKSRLVLQLGLCVATGTPFFGQPVNQGAVAYLSLEDPPQLTQKRLVGTQQRLNARLSRGSFFVHTTWVQGDDAVELARERLQEMTDPRLLIIDVLQRVRSQQDSRKPQYEVDYEQLKPWAELRRDFPSLSIVIVHHTRKYKSREVEDPFTEISGTQGLAGSVDSMWMLLRPGKEQTDKIDPEAVKDKLLFYARSRYMEHGDVELVVESQQDLMVLTDMKPWELVTAEKQVELRRLMETEPEKMWTAKELHAMLEDGTKITTTQQTLKRMAKRGWVIGHHGEGYTLAGESAKF